MPPKDLSLQKWVVGVVLSVITTTAAYGAYIVENRASVVEQHAVAIAVLEARFNALDQRFSKLESTLERMDAKMDALIEAQHIKENK